MNFAKETIVEGLTMTLIMFCAMLFWLIVVDLVRCLFGEGASPCRFVMLNIFADDFARIIPLLLILGYCVGLVARYKRAKP